MKKLLYILNACCLLSCADLSAMRIREALAENREQKLDEKAVRHLTEGLNAIFCQGFLEDPNPGDWCIKKMDLLFSDHYKPRELEIREALTRVFKKEPFYKEMLDHLNMLHAAVKYDCTLKLIAILIGYGVNVLRKDNSGLTPVKYASKSDNGRKIYLRLNVQALSCKDDQTRRKDAVFDMKFRGRVGIILYSNKISGLELDFDGEDSSGTESEEPSKATPDYHA